MRLDAQDENPCHLGHYLDQNTATSHLQAQDQDLWIENDQNHDDLLYFMFKYKMNQWRIERNTCYCKVKLEKGGNILVAENIS